MFRDKVVFINGDWPALAAEFRRQGAELATEASARVDVLVNCGRTSSDYRAAFEADVFTPLQLMQTVLPGMIERRYGRIVNFCSLNPADASKFALEGMSRSARIELHRHGVRILHVYPGPDGVTEKDAARVVHAALRGRRELILTGKGKWLWWLRKFSPACAEHLLPA